MKKQEPSYFDLNIGEILEGWTARHAVREIISNALDEQALTGTKDVVISEVRGGWSIRDHGRGLRFEHLRQDENAEKLASSSKVIGKFGFGLKDGLATLHRRGVEVEILSPHGNITVTERAKHGFDSVPTLHAIIAPATDPGRVGTEVILRGLGNAEMAAAKAFFLRFSGEEVLGRTQYGEILRRRNGQAGRVYVKGLLAAEEPAFGFSYNVTSLTAAMNKALNRERSNVGRSAYSDRVKAMLLACAAPAVAEILAVEIGKLNTGTAHDEVKWHEVAVHACKILNETKKVVFVSSEELVDSRDMVDHAQGDGLRLITLPQNIRDKLRGARDAAGAPVRGLDVFAKEWVDSFEFKFLSEASLTASERSLFARRHAIAALGGGWPDEVREVLITETMRPDEHGRTGAVGLWEKHLGRIVVKRDQLRSPKRFAGTLLHEITHITSGEDDVSRGFESALTDLVGHIVANALEPPARSRLNATPQSKAKAATKRKMTGSRKTKTKAKGRSRPANRRRG